MKPDVEFLRRILFYNPETGEFTWLRRTDVRRLNWNDVFAGKIAGCFSKGYRVIRINNILYRAHLLAWLYHFGEWPPNVIDHINGDPADNRISNLRLATQAENVRNKRGRRRSEGRTSKYKGVFRSKGANCFCVQVQEKHRGCFHNEIDAAICANYNTAYLFGEFARLNEIPIDAVWAHE